MIANGRVAPRFVPTLTEVVREPARLVATVSPVAPAAPVGAPVQPPSSAPPMDNAALVEWIQAEVADSLQRNLHDMIATALVEQIDVVAARLHGDIEPLVRRAVQEAVASEAATRAPG